MYKILPQFPHYQIFDNGTIRSLYTNKILTPEKNHKGYLTVKLYENQSKTTCLIHRLVAMAFIDNPNNYEQVNHKDENKQNNMVENLEWCNNNYNANYGTRNERIARTNSKPIYCIELERAFFSAAEAERELNIDSSSITANINGKRKSAGGYHWRRLNENEKDLLCS